MSDKWDTSAETVPKARVLARYSGFDGDVLDAMEHVNPRARWGDD